jgi:hypothetical protein
MDSGPSFIFLDGDAINFVIYEVCNIYTILIPILLKHKALKQNTQLYEDAVNQFSNLHYSKVVLSCTDLAGIELKTRNDLYSSKTFRCI